jgi:parallel beta-helix repeat protein
MALTKVSYSMITGTVVNVLDFGADPTGVADSTTQMQAALTAVSANGGAVYVPTGTYKISTTLQISGNTRLYGDGNSSVITTSSNIQSLTGSNTGSNVLYGVSIESIRFDNTFPVSQVAGPVLTATLTSGNPIVVVTSIAGLYNGMSITGTGIPAGTYIQVSNYSTAVFLRNSSGAPVNATTSGSKTLSTFFAQGQTNFHIYFLNPEFPYLNNVEFTTSFTDVQYSPNNHAGLFLDTTGTGFEGNVTNCFFNHAQYQHNISDSRITNNVIWANPFDYALKINQPDTIVSNNSLSAGVVQGGLWVTTAAADSNITGNNIDGGSVWYTGYGITLNQTFSVNITGNRFNNIYKGGIYLTDGSYLTITGNVFINTNYSNSLFNDIEIDDISYGTTHCTITGNTFYQSNTLTNPGYAIKEVNVTGGNPSANSYSCNAVSSNYAVPSMLVLNPYNIEQVANVGSVTNGLVAFTPSFVNLTLGNGTVTAYYQRTNSQITVCYFLTVGSTTTFSSSPFGITLPVAANASIGSQGSALGSHSGGATQVGGTSLVNAGATYGYIAPGATGGAFWNATVPWTWAATDTISFSLIYNI